VFAQHEPKAWVWLREAGSLGAQPREIVGLDEVIRIAALETEPPLVEAYAGLPFGLSQR